MAEIVPRDLLSFIKDRWNKGYDVINDVGTVIWEYINLEEPSKEGKDLIMLDSQLKEYSIVEYMGVLRELERQDQITIKEMDIPEIFIDFLEKTKYTGRYNMIMDADEIIKEFLTSDYDNKEETIYWLIEEKDSVNLDKYDEALEIMGERFSNRRKNEYFFIKTTCFPGGFFFDLYPFFISVFLQMLLFAFICASLYLFSLQSLL